MSVSQSVSHEEILVFNHLVLDSRGSGHQSRISLTTKRKSWKSPSFREPPRDEASGSGQDVPDITVGTRDSHKATVEPEKHGGSNKGDMRMKKRVNLAKEARPAKPRTEFKRRPQSAPNKKALKTEPEPERIALGEYSKSLKLLGVDVPSNRTEATKVKSQEIQVKTKEPTFRTRLLKRSGSYADLTKHINKDMKKSEFESVKSDLNKAIFEEWYFKKLEAEREKKAKIKEEEEKKTREEEEKKRDIEEQSKVRF